MAEEEDEAQQELHPTEVLRLLRLWFLADHYLEGCRPDGAEKGVVAGRFRGAWLDRVVEGQGVIKCLTVRYLVLSKFRDSQRVN